MPPPIRLALILAVPALVAAMAGDQSLAHIVVERDVPVKMRDGVTLMADVYRPEGPGRFPALVWVDRAAPSGVFFLWPVWHSRRVRIEAVTADQPMAARRSRAPFDLGLRPVASLRDSGFQAPSIGAM